MSVKKLASQTLWYGLSNILGRFLNYFLFLLLAYLYLPEEIAQVAQVYVIVPFLNILFTMGLETSYFRYSNQIEKQKLFNTLNSFLLLTTVGLTLILFLGATPIVGLIEMTRHTSYYYWMLLIVSLDTLTVLPFAKLRQEGRPKKFAMLKLISIVINVGLVVFFLMACPYLIKQGYSLPTYLYDPSVGIGYYIIANLIATFITLFLLFPEWKGFTFKIDKSLLKEIMTYSFPIIIVGFGGMINDFLSRVTYYKVLHDPIKQLDHEFGVFTANYRLAVLATLFIQVFKMGAEPFFFNQAKNKDAPETYARITNIFVIICCYIFLCIAMNLDVLKLLIASKHKEYAEGIHIVPVLTMANIFIGIYYNLAIWYKLTNQTMKGAIITLLGVVVTIVLNLILVPYFHYTGAAWATFFCYFFMMVVSLVWGQKYYPIPYAIKKLSFYLLLVIAMFVLYQGAFTYFNYHGLLLNSIVFLASIAIFSLVVLKYDKEEIRKFPFIGKYIH